MLHATARTAHLATRLLGVTSVMFALAVSTPSAAAAPRSTGDPVAEEPVAKTPAAKSDRSAARTRAPEEAGDDEHDGDAPARQIPERTRAPAHADCDLRVPLWEHVVDKGEHLGGIAGRYGVRRADILRLNPDLLKNPDLIRTGQKLRVCPTIAPRLRKEIEVVVKPGDTVGALALEHGVTVNELVAMQRGELSDPNRLSVGKKLRVVVDAGIAPDFLPAEEPKPARKSGGRSRSGKPIVRRVGQQLPLADDDYFVKRPHLAWGTATTINNITQAVDQYKRRHSVGPLVHIGDISKQGGGPLYPHLSHRVGRDVDVGYVLRGEDADRTRFSGVTHANLDVARTWSLVKAFVDTGGVEVIFLDYGLQKILYEYAKERGTSEEELDELFQYPRGRGRSHGIIRHWRSHQHHFHVRFKS